MAGGGEPAGSAHRVLIGTGATQVGGQVAQPGLGETLLDDVEERPDRPFGKPGVGVAVHAGGGGHGGADEAAGKGKLDVGADAVTPAVGDTEAARQLLGQPALDAAGGHGDDLGGHRILEGVGQHIAERTDETISSLGSMNVQHVVSSQARSGDRTGREFRTTACQAGVTVRLDRGAGRV